MSVYIVIAKRFILLPQRKSGIGEAVLSCHSDAIGIIQLFIERNFTFLQKTVVTLAELVEGYIVLTVFFQNDRFHGRAAFFDPSSTNADLVAVQIISDLETQSGFDLLIIRSAFQIRFALFDVNQIEVAEHPCRNTEPIQSIFFVKRVCLEQVPIVILVE